MTRRPRRRGLIVAALVVVGAVLAGVVWWVWPSAERSDAVPGTLQASVLTTVEASKLVGVTLGADTSSSEPPPAVSVVPDTCAVAAGPGTQSVYARGWTAFGSVTYQDSEAVADHTVTQVLGVYPDPDKAGAVFRTLTEGLKGCESALRTDQDQDLSKWEYKLGATTATSLAWTATQDNGDGWACHRQARLKGSTVVQAAVCGAGDGQQAAAKIIQQVADKVNG